MDVLSTVHLPEKNGPMFFGAERPVSLLTSEKSRQDQKDNTITYRPGRGRGKSTLQKTTGTFFAVCLDNNE